MKLTPFHRHRIEEDDRGVTPQQMLIGLGLFAAASLLALGGAKLASDQLARTTLLSQVNDLAANISGYYMGTGDYGTGSMNATIVSKNLYPPGLLVGGALVNKYGGDVLLTGNGRTYTSVFTGIPNDACSSVATAPGQSIQSITVNTTTMALPITSAAADAVCTIAGQGQSGGNTITWVRN